MPSLRVPSRTTPPDPAGAGSGCRRCRRVRGALARYPSPLSLICGYLGIGIICALGEDLFTDPVDRRLLLFIEWLRSHVVGDR